MGTIKDSYKAEVKVDKVVEVEVGIGIIQMVPRIINKIKEVWGTTLRVS